MMKTPSDFRLQAGHEDHVPADSYGKRIGVLIVAYNAVSTLAHVLKRIPPAVWQNVEEVVVFDDASHDATYELAVGFKTLAEMPKLKVLRHSQNLGYGGNQKAGYRYFMDKGFDAIVLLHGDGQYAPEILHHMYGPIVAGTADAVSGSRMMKDYGGPLKGGMPLYKYVGNRILSTFENRVLGMSLTEFHSGYRAYNLHALRKIDLSKMTDDFHFDTEILIKLNHQGFRIKEVPIPTYYGSEICYVNGMKYANNVAKAVLRYRTTVRSVKRHPEFMEYFSHYPLRGTKYSSHYYVEHFVKANQSVLDVGCGEGFLASKLSRPGTSIVGIDIVPAPSMRHAFSHYICADLSNGLADAAVELQGAAFDRILMMDILEHVARPEMILNDCRRFLRPGGQVMISLPNVANVTVRLALAFGRFEYAERGIMDKSHLRFFTRKTARQLLTDSGFKVVEERATTMPIDLALGLSSQNVVVRGLNRALAFLTTLFPRLLGYQWVFVVEPTAASRINAADDTEMARSGDSVGAAGVAQ